MSLIIERFLMCDGPECDETFGVDTRQFATNMHRAQAKKEGWYSRNGKDFCPGCVANEEEVNAFLKRSGSKLRFRRFTK